MASKPKEVYLKEVCSKCRPYGLGVGKQLRDFEALVSEEEIPGKKEGKERQKASSKVDSSLGSGAKVDEKKEVFHPPALNATSAPERLLPAQPSIHIPEPKPSFEQPLDSIISTDTQERKDRWVDVCPTAENGKTTPSVSLTKKSSFGLLSKIFQPFLNAKSPKSEEENTTQGIEEQNVEEENIDEEESDKGWEDVKDDPDWDVLSNEERKEKRLWKDDGEWVDVE